MFKSILIAIALLFSTVSFAQTCPGPVGCLEPVGPSEICLPWGCSPVTYLTVDSNFVIAISQLPINSGCETGFGPAPTPSCIYYKVMGWAGPCSGELHTCQNIKVQAYDDMRTNLLRINRSFWAAGVYN
ncbi:MAG: hypothetical protein IPH62_19965 [Ignavibacteriae bacterium]|nr:hypothetical protein [Ignavibacteriota bacterium]